MLKTMLRRAGIALVLVFIAIQAWPDGSRVSQGLAEEVLQPTASVSR